jgi:PAS domain S-box-containing protein
VNHQCEKLTRRSREQLLGQNIWEMFPQAVDSVFYEQYHKAVSEQIAVTVEAVLPVGSGRWFEARAYPKSNGLAIFFQDITDRKQAELALRASETRFANLATNLPGVIYQYRVLSDGRDEFPYISSGCLDLYEIDSQNIQQHPHLFWQAIHPDDVEGLTG